MADQDKPEPDDIDKDSQPAEPPAEGDLGFADDSWAEPPPQPPIAGLDRDFIPQPRANAESSNAEPTDDQPEERLQEHDTWVPEVTGGGADQVDASATAADDGDNGAAPDKPPVLDAGKTWVPPNTPNRQGAAPTESSAADEIPAGEMPADKAPAGEAPANSAADQGHPDDVNRTWVPSSTPTVDAADLQAEQANAPGDGSHGEDADDTDDTNRTWVPSGTPTVQGDLSGRESGAADASAGEQVEDGDDADDDPLAVDKTWVASELPTVSDADALGSDGTATVAGPAAADHEPDDTDKTWVPTSSPTHHAMGGSGDEDGSRQPGEPGATSDENDAADDTSKTWVPSDTPTADAMASDPTEMRTVVAGPPPDAALNSSDSAVMETVEAPLIGSEQTVFSQTMGMRNPGNDDFDDWQAEQDQLNEGDTAVVDLPNDGSTPTSRKTQIWSQQSGDGLSSALTIRHAPVAGESLFDNTLNSDKPDYQIISKLAEGGMGAVYVARQTSLGRELAIKTLKPLRERDRKTYTAQGRISQVENQRREMFLSEALVTGNLVHPHIIPIHDLCQTDDGSPFYSMKRVHGTPWNERIGEMSLDENLEVLLKVCDAMAYAHHNGVVNRDLKPENVMLGEFGEVLVLDWGLAVPASPKDKGRFPSPAAPFGAGTPAYMSPELWTGPENHIGVWSDVYLLGATLFEAITGAPPHEFPEPDSSAGNTGLWMTIDKVVRRNSIRRTEHTGELMDIALKAMATAPKHRYRTVLQFQNAIKEWQQHEESRRLARRADKSLESTDHQDRRQDYQNFQTAAALYEEAHVAWPDNQAARTGLRDTRLKYARLARVKGDYDLGLQIAMQEEDEEFQELKQKLKRARLRRNSLKTATVVATLAVFCVGVISFIQRMQIVALVGTKESLETEVAQAEQKRVDAERLTTAAQDLAAQAKDEAEAAGLLVEQKQKEVEEKQAEVQEKQREIETKDVLVKMKQQELTTAQEELSAKEGELAEKVEELMQSEREIAISKAELEEAEQEVEDAKREIAESEMQLAKINQQKEDLNREKLRAGVDLENAKIASSIRNADFPAALRIVENLLTRFEDSEELQQLPADERADRIRELKARQQQLQRRATRTEVPVQSQVFSVSGRLLVQGDAAGRVVVRRVERAFDQLPDALVAQTEIGGSVRCLQIAADESWVVAATGTDLVFWNLADGTTQRQPSGTANVSTLRLRDGILISADTNGLITGWDPQTQQPQWSIRSTSSIRDLDIMPSSRMFVYAGSRGGQSADILAYRLPPVETPRQRPQRLGQLRLPRNRNFPPRCVAVSPDESTLLIGNSRNGELICLRRRTPVADDRDQFPFEHAADLSTGDAADWLLNRHQRPINDIAFASDGRRVVTASDDRSVCVWEIGAANPTLIERLEGHGARVNSAVFVDAAGRFVLSASADRSCRSWDVQQYDAEHEQLQQDFPDTVDSAAVSPASTPEEAISGARRQQTGYLLARAAARGLQTGQADDGSDHKEHLVLNADNAEQRGAINSISLSADGRRLVTGADDGSAVIWDTATGTPIKGVSTRTTAGDGAVAFEEGHEFNVARLRFLPPDGNILLTTGFDGTLCLWDADTRKRHAGRQELKLPGLGLVNAVAASADGRLVATSAGGVSRRAGAAVIWKTASLLTAGTPEILAELTGFHRAEVSTIAFSPDAQLVATGGRDGRVAVWRVADARLVAVGQVHARNTIVSHLQWTAADQLLTAGFDGRLSLLQIADRPAGQESPGRLNEIRAFEHDRVPIERVAVAPGGERFVTISVRTDTATQRVDYELELWQRDQAASAGKIHLAKVRGQSVDRIVAVNWSVSGDRLAVVADNHLQILETEAWRVVSVLDSPGLGISDVVFAPAGIDRPERDHVIATFDGTAAHLWNIKDRTHLVDFRPLFAVQSTAYVEQDDERLLITGDRALRVFQADESRGDFGQTLLKIGDPHAGIINHIQFAQGGDASSRWFATTGADGTVALWQWQGERQGAQFVRWLREEETPVVSAAWLAEGRLLITERDGRLQLVSIDEPGQARVLEVDPTRELRLARARVSPDGQFVAVAGQDAASGESLAWVFALHGDKLQLHCRILGGHEAGGVRDICFLPDSPYLMTGGADGGALIWNWLPRRSASTPLLAYEAFQFLAENNSLAHNAPITCVEVAADGTIATASEDGTAIVWNNPFR